MARLQTQLDLPFRLPPAPGAQRRHIQLGARIITYALVRSRRRTLGLMVDHRGLRVGAPRAAGMGEIERFIRGNGEWVLRKIEEWQRERPPEPLVVRDGALLPVLGETVRIDVVHGANRIRWNDAALVLEAAPGASVQALAERALKQRAQEVFAERVKMLAHTLGRPAPPMRLSSAQTRWGSCSEKTGIRLNWRLIHLPLALVDYVAAHELAHLVEMNHSPRFWSVVERLYPDYSAARSELKRLASQLPQL